MRRNVKLDGAIRIGFGLMIFLFIGTEMIGFLTTNALTRNIRWVEHTNDVIMNLTLVEKHLVDAETGERGFIITGSDAFLEPYNKGREDLKNDLTGISRLVSDNPAQIQRLANLEVLARQKIDNMAGNVTLKKSGKEKELISSVKSGTGKKIMDDVRRGISEMKAVESELLSKRSDAVSQSRQLYFVVTIAGIILVVTIGIVIMLYISRKVVQPTRQIADTIAHTSAEIAATVTQHERTAIQQASMVNETTSTVAELDASFRQASEQAASTSAVAQKASTMTMEGNNALQQAIGAMNGLRDKVGTIAEQILRLGEQTGQIGNIANMVRDMASEINMLALNAAVEAARAGDNGKGFAVVASEVRKLAKESKKSAEQASIIVADIQKATNSTIMKTEEGTKTVEEVTRLAKQVGELFDALSGAAGSVYENAQQGLLNTRQQLAAINQVVEAANSINAGAKETVAGISQTKTGIQKLNETAQELKVIM